jgi:O-antigen ligase
MLPVLETALIALGALLVIGIGISRPTLILIIYAALVPIGGVFEIPIPLAPPFNSLSSLLGGILIIATILHVLLYGRGRIPSLPVAVWFVFLSWSAMTAFWAQQPAAAIEELRLAVPFILLLAAVGVLPSGGKDVGGVRVAIVAGGAVIGAYALLLLMSGSALPIHGTTERLAIASAPDQTDPNQLAAALILPLILSLDLILWGHGPRLRPRTWKVVGAGGALLISIALIMTGSRGGVIAALTAFVLILIFAWRWHPQSRRSVIRLITGVIVTVALLSFASFIAISLSPQGRWAGITSIDPVQRLTRTEVGSSGRSDIWTTGAVACRQFCASGAGIGNFETVFTELFATSGAERNVGLDRPGHNLYVQVAVEAGLVGLALLGFAFASEWTAVRSTGDLAPALAAALLALLVVDAFESFIWFKYFWLLFIVIRLAERPSLPRRPTSARLARGGEFRRVRLVHS